MPDNDDKTVKELIDEGTRADLERWFGLPSFEQLAEQQQKKQQPVEEPDRVAFQKQRAAALAAVDPNMLAAHRRRVERQHDLMLFEPRIEPRISPRMMMLDQAMIDRGHTLADPREYELPDDLDVAMQERTPQALLRDLHRPELVFEKIFEITDVIAESRVDLRATINEALAFRPSSTKKPESKLREAIALLAEMRRERRKPWTALTSKMPNRRVTE
jgi:hypothetical protein